MCLCVAEEDETAHQTDLAGAWTCGYSLQPKPWFDFNNTFLSSCLSWKGFTQSKHLTRKSLIVLEQNETIKVVFHTW